jgi:hypothetical protein
LPRSATTGIAIATPTMIAIGARKTTTRTMTATVTGSMNGNIIATTTAMRRHQRRGRPLEQHRELAGVDSSAHRRGL